jgi:hypothetical protein
MGDPVSNSLATVREELRNRVGRYFAQQQENISSSNTELPDTGLPKTHWKLTEKLRVVYKTQIFPKLNSELQPYFDSDRKGELFTIEAYMIGKSREKAKPTILLIGGDVHTREGAKEVIERSHILKEYGWQLEDTSNFTGLSGTYNEPSILVDFEFFASDGTIEWLNSTNHDGATEVYFDLRLYLSTGMYRTKGLAIYIKHSSGLRRATANVVCLENRVYLQSVYHAFKPVDQTNDERVPTVSDRLPRCPSLETLTFVGRLLVWSVERDWSLIDVLSKDMKPWVATAYEEDKKSGLRNAFQTAIRPRKSGSNGYVWTSSGGKDEVIVSQMSAYMKLPNSSYFQEVHKASLVQGSWSNGDCGAVVTGNGNHTYGHVLGGNRASGVAVIVAADKVVKDFEELDFSILARRQRAEVVSGESSLQALLIPPLSAYSGTEPGLQKMAQWTFRSFRSKSNNSPAANRKCSAEGFCPFLRILYFSWANPW